MFLARTILVAQAIEAMVGVIAAVDAVAARLLLDRASVRREGRADAVGLPHIHLNAARAVLPGAGVGVRLGGRPVDDVGLAVDELDVARALGVAVSGTILGTCLIAWEPRHPTIRVHLNKIDGSVDTTRHARYFEQAFNGVVARMALLCRLLNVEVPAVIGGDD